MVSIIHCFPKCLILLAVLITTRILLGSKWFEQKTNSPETIPFIELKSSSYQPEPISADQSSRNNRPRTQPVRTGRRCYTTEHIDTDRIQLLDDVLVAGKLQRNGSNIFFHETSCLDGVIRLSVRQGCAIESAARANPTAQVYLLYASPVGFERDQPTPPVLAALAQYPNIRWFNLNLWTYTKRTPAANWIEQPDLYTSKYLGQNIANLLRLLSLYRWGGTYLDLDFVVRSSLVDLPPNFAGLESDILINNALLNFSPDGIGHVIVRRAIKKFISGFNGQAWGMNGPYLITRVLRKLCHTNEFTECTIFKIYPQNTFYSVEYYYAQVFFEKEWREYTMELVNSSIAVHIWNKITSKEVVQVGDGSAYEQLAKKYCPHVLATVTNGEF